jgi:site-specific DNA recombinase
MIPPRRLRAAGYRRVSMREQVDGFSLDAQETNIRTFTEQQGWTLVELYTDAGISAKKGSHRPAFEQLLKDAAYGQFDVVVVDKIDRFYRHLNGLLTTLDHLHKYEVSFASVKEKLDFTTPWGKLMLTVLGMLAEIYLDNLRQETRKGKLARARQGLWNGNPPYGYCRGLCSSCEEPNGKDYCPAYGEPDRSDGKVLIPHPIESQVVIDLFTRYATGEHSDASLAVYLNATPFVRSDGTEVPILAKYIHHSRTVRTFGRDAVRGILTRIFYLGKIPYYGPRRNGKLPKRENYTELFDGQHAPLVSEELFAKVKHVRASRISSHGPTLRTGTKSKIYPLSGLLYCLACGSRMHGAHNGKNSYYRDASCITRDRVCPNPGYIRQKQLEQKVIKLLHDMGEHLPFEPQVFSTRNALADAEAQYERARQLFLAGHFSLEEVKNEKRALQKARKHLQSLNGDAILEKIGGIRTLATEFESILPIKRRTLLNDAITAVFIQEKGPVAVQLRHSFQLGMGGILCGPDGNGP